MILFPSGLTQSRMFSTGFIVIFKRKSAENLIVLRVSTNCAGYKEEYYKDSKSITKYYIQR